MGMDLTILRKGRTSAKDVPEVTVGKTLYLDVRKRTQVKGRE